MGDSDPQLGVVEPITEVLIFSSMREKRVSAPTTTKFSLFRSSTCLAVTIYPVGDFPQFEREKSLFVIAYHIIFMKTKNNTSTNNAAENVF